MQFDQQNLLFPTSSIFIQLSTLRALQYFAANQTYIEITLTNSLLQKPTT